MWHCWGSPQCRPCHQQPCWLAEHQQPWPGGQCQESCACLHPPAGRSPHLCDVRCTAPAVQYMHACKNTRWPKEGQIRGAAERDSQGERARHHNAISGKLTRASRRPPESSNSSCRLQQGSQAENNLQGQGRHHHLQAWSAQCTVKASTCGKESQQD